MSSLPEAFAGRSPQPAMEAGGAGKPGEVAFLKVMKGWLDQYNTYLFIDSLREMCVKQLWPSR
jgi:hypothetical protein